VISIRIFRRLVPVSRQISWPYRRPVQWRRGRSAELLRSGPEYEGMGLGCFMQKTLLGTTGAELRFAMARTRTAQPKRTSGCGQSDWPRAKIGADTGTRAPYGGKYTVFVYLIANRERCPDLCV